MKIGLVSDSHGHRIRLAAAIDLLISRGAEAVVHCGDIGSPACLGTLAAAPVLAYAVAGNVDQLLAAAGTVPAAVTFSPVTVEVRIAPETYLVATHGHQHGLVSSLIAGGQFAYVCHGHTHSIRDERIDGVRVICPGALTRPRAPAQPTCALLDTACDTLEFIEVPA